MPTGGRAHSRAREEVRRATCPPHPPEGGVRLHTPCLEVVHLKIRGEKELLSELISFNFITQENGTRRGPQESIDL